MKVVSIVVAPCRSRPSPVVRRGSRCRPNTVWKMPLATRHRSARTLLRSGFVTRTKRAITRMLPGGATPRPEIRDRGAYSPQGRDWPLVDELDPDAGGSGVRRRRRGDLSRFGENRELAGEA